MEQAEGPLNLGDEIKAVGRGMPCLWLWCGMPSGSSPPAAAQALATESSLFIHKRSVEQAEHCMPADGNDKNRLFSEKGISK